MKSQDKVRVAVLFGGRSAEHEISLQSAANVIQYLDKSRYEVVPIGISKQGHWFLGYELLKQHIDEKEKSKLLAEANTWFTPEWISKPVVQHQPNEIIKRHGALFDVVFPAVHGSFCEDGTLQGLLELANLPYVGCGVLASSIGMDKDISKRLASLAGVNVAPYVAIKFGEWQQRAKNYLQQIEEELTYPLFVKPANTGSSIGISKVKARDGLEAAITEAFRFDTKILIEQGIHAAEIELAVLESLIPGKEPIVSIPGEIRSRHDFYSYDAKYLDENGAELLIPAPISDKIAEQAKTIAKKIFAALECEGMARVDLFLDKTNGELYFNEINTIPGFTKISMYPKLLAASGIDYQALLTHLIELAMNKYKFKSKIKRSYTD